MKHLDAEVAKIIHFGTPEEFFARPSFRGDVFAPKVKPQRIIGSYRFQAPFRCGIRGCHLTHEHGYVVLLPDGSETNTGWDCGLDHFGMEFLTLRAVYDRVEREYPHREGLRQRISEVDRFRARIDDLRHQLHGGDWLRQNLRLFARHYPPSVVETLRQYSGRGQVTVFEAPVRSDTAIEVTHVADFGIGAADRGEPRGTVLGLRIFKLDLENWPLDELEQQLNELVRVDAENVPFEEVRRWAGWADGLEASLAEFKLFLDAGKRFFTRGNLDLLPYLVDDQELKEQLMWMVLSKEANDSNIPAPRKLSPFERLLRGLNS